MLASITEKSPGTLTPISNSVRDGSRAKSVEDAINELYASNSHDEVAVSALFVTRSFANKYRESVKTSIEAQESGATVTKGSVSKQSLVDFVNANIENGSVSVDFELDDILNEYIEIAVALL